MILLELDKTNNVTLGANTTTYMYLNASSITFSDEEVIMIQILLGEVFDGEVTNPCLKFIFLFNIFF